MLTRRSTLAVVGLLAVGVGFGAVRLVGSGDAPPPRTAALPISIQIGSINDQLARLPSLRPGELDGVLDLVGDSCEPTTLDLATFVRSETSRDVCRPVGAVFGVRLVEVSPTGFPLTLEVIDAAGAATERVKVPAGWPWWRVTAEGIVFCDQRSVRGRVRSFAGATRRLPGCPLDITSARLIFAGPGRTSLVDAAGRHVVALHVPLPPQATVRVFGDELVAVGPELYRAGRHVATVQLEPPFAEIISASRDGRVLLVGNASQNRLGVVRDGTTHPIEPVLANLTGVVAPDGRHLMLERSQSLLIELEADTLRPIARLGLDPPRDVVDWRP
jgi:hypothetical protein